MKLREGRLTGTEEGGGEVRRQSEGPSLQPAEITITKAVRVASRHFPASTKCSLFQGMSQHHHLTLILARNLGRIPLTILPSSIYYAWGLHFLNTSWISHLSTIPPVATLAHSIHLLQSTPAHICLCYSNLQTGFSGSYQSENQNINFSNGISCWLAHHLYVRPITSHFSLVYSSINWV